MEAEFQIRLNATNFARMITALCLANDECRELANRISLEHDVVVPAIQTELANLLGGN